MVGQTYLELFVTHLHLVTPALLRCYEVDSNKNGRGNRVDKARIYYRNVIFRKNKKCVFETDSRLGRIIQFSTVFGAERDQRKIESDGKLFFLSSPGGPFRGTTKEEMGYSISTKNNWDIQL